MKKIKYLICLFALLIVLILSLSVGATEYPSDGALKWKGHNWYLTNGKSDPGNNYWNNAGAWVDAQNRLHLTIVQNKGIWKCTELSSQNKYLYGTFTWTVASPVYTFDKNCVMGLFLYQDDNHEIDIETTKWGNAEGNNLWYTVQPTKVEGNVHGYLIPSSIKGTNTIYRIEWKPKYVRFTSMQANGKVIADYNYTNSNKIPQNPERVIMNLWLMDPPSNGKNIELIISDFTVTSN